MYSICPIVLAATYSPIFPLGAEQEWWLQQETCHWSLWSFSSCGNIPSDSCVPLVTVTLSECITIKAGRNFGIILTRFLDATSVVKVHTISIHLPQNYNPMFSLDRRMACSLAFARKSAYLSALFKTLWLAGAASCKESKPAKVTRFSRLSVTTTTTVDCYTKEMGRTNQPHMKWCICTFTTLGQFFMFFSWATHAAQSQTSCIGTFSDHAHLRSNRTHFWTIDATATRFSPQKNV